MSRIPDSEFDKVVRPTEGVPLESIPAYSTTIHWFPDDGCWVATCPELLELFGNEARSTGDTPGEAADELAGVVQGLAADRIRKQRLLPREDTFRVFSGTLTLRMPIWLHERIAEEARRDRVSINTWLVSRLAQAAGALR
ncbi:MAG TPA: toxin-antitoxin system HicB family antitoxin [Longimicrobiales bacterium]|nr:toxin-antitoxin system HicB family antitoxin [Longimicrobiales bacterium]